MIDPDPCRSRDAVAALGRLGWKAAGCSGVDEAEGLIADAAASGEGFSAAFVELAAPDGSSAIAVKVRGFARWVWRGRSSSSAMRMSSASSSTGLPPPSGDHMTTTP